jgi:hypothetical protein
MLGDQLVQLFHEFHVCLIDEMKMPALVLRKGMRATKGGDRKPILGSERMLCEFNRCRSTSGNYATGLIIPDTCWFESSPRIHRSLTVVSGGCADVRI